MIVENTVERVTTGGTIVGELADGILRFTGVRYGELADGKRFDEVAPVSTSSRGQDRRAKPAVFPQLPSRLALVMGHGIESHPQEEDAFLLNVWAPAGVENAPVLVFVHGGAFVSGGGTAAWYDGTRLAAKGLVVVTVNYRLGVLGHLVNGTNNPDPNRPVRDILAALEWVRENIASFGGNAGNVTLSGQSAGGWYTQLLSVIPEARGLFRRAIVLSAPLGTLGSPTLAQGINDAITAELEGDDPNAVEISRLLLANVKAGSSQPTELGLLPLGLAPVVGGLVPSWIDDFEQAAAHAHVESILFHRTRHETSAFFFASERARAVSWDEARRLARAFNLDEQSIDTAPSPYDLFVAATTERMFGQPPQAFSAALRDQGIESEVVVFEPASPMVGLGAPHCFDLPFLFGNRSDWGDAPMLDGVSDEEFEDVGNSLRDMFVRVANGTTSPGAGSRAQQ